MVFELSWGSGIVSFLVTLLVTSLFIYFAARIILDRASFIVAVLVALIGSLLFVLVWGLADRLWDIAWLGPVLAIATWALVAALFFRTSWLRGAVIGLVAWVLAFLVGLLISWLFARLG